MKFKLPQLILLFGIGIADAYMISHPNILGKIGIRIYQYDWIKNFQSALITLVLGITFCLILSYFLQNQKGKKWAKYTFLILIILSLVVFFDIFIKFSAGSYAHTGKVFKFGMHLMPLIFSFIFSNGLLEWHKNNIN